MPVYFAKTHTGSIKIGSSPNAEYRCGELGRYYGRPVELIKTIDGGEREEREFHRRFAAYRLGGHGAWTEQFQPGPELAEYLGIPAPPDYEAIDIAVPAETDGYYRKEERSLADLPPGMTLFLGLPTCPWTRGHAAEATAEEAVRGDRKRAICGIWVTLRAIPWADSPGSVDCCSRCNWKAGTPAAVAKAREDRLKNFRPPR